MMFCKKCGSEVAENAKFCPKCGARLETAVRNLLKMEVPEDLPY